MTRTSAASCSDQVSVRLMSSGWPQPAASYQCTGGCPHREPQGRATPIVVNALRRALTGKHVTVGAYSASMIDFDTPQRLPLILAMG